MYLPFGFNVFFRIFGILGASFILLLIFFSINIYSLYSVLSCGNLFIFDSICSSISNRFVYAVLYIGFGNKPSIIASHKSYLLTILLENNSFVSGLAISLSYGVFLSLMVYAVIPNTLIFSCVSIKVFILEPHTGAPK